MLFIKTVPDVILKIITDLIVNEDITYHLFSYLDLKTVSTFARVNSRIYYVLASTALYSEIKIISKIGRLNLPILYQLKLTHILQKIMTKNYQPGEFDLECISIWGDASMLNWIMSSCPSLRQCNAIKTAVIERNLGVLQWYHRAGYDLTLTQEYYVGIQKCYLVDLIAENGHLIILQWIQSINLPYHHSDCAITWAAKNGYITILDWFAQQQQLNHCSDWALIEAASKGQIEVLDWFKTHRLMSTFSYQLTS